jgi:hypothetical protein
LIGGIAPSHGLRIFSSTRPAGLLGALEIFILWSPATDNLQKGRAPSRAADAIATRYEQLAESFLGVLFIASARY